MSVSLSIDRSGMPGAPAPLVATQNDSDLMLDEDFGFGQVEQQRNTVTSPFVDRRILISVTEGTPTATGGVVVFAADEATLKSRITDVVTALTQRSFTITYAHGATNWTATCEPADYGLGPDGVFDGPAMAQHFQVVRFSIPLASGPL